MGDLNQLLLNLAQQLGPGVLVVLFAIGFSQTGLILGPLIPGNTILFATGVLTGTSNLILSWPNVVAAFIFGAIAGNYANYVQGAKIGTKAFQKRETGLVSIQSLNKTEGFFARHGRLTMLFSPFVPIVRSFAPFVAGVGNMPFSSYFGFAALGVTLWVVCLVSMGAGLGQVPWIKQNLGVFVLAVFLLASAQLLFVFFKRKTKD